MPLAPITRRPLLICLAFLLIAALWPAILAAEGPDDSLDWETERARTFEQCAQARESCNRQNCEQHDHYSGCAVDCIGCFDMTVSYAFNETSWALHPSYGACVMPIIRGYIGEVASIQSDFVARTIDLYQQKESERAIRDVVSEALKACERNACQAKCADLGTTGGFQGWDCVCDPVPEPTASEAAEQIAEPSPDNEPSGSDSQIEARPEAPAEADTAEHSEGSVEKEDEHAGAGAGAESLSPPDPGDEGPSGDRNEDAQGVHDRPRWWKDASEARPRVHGFRIRPVSTVSGGIVYGFTRVTYEVQEILDDGSTGRRCTLRFSGKGLTLGWLAGANFAPGYQWSEMQVRGGWRMSLEELDGAQGWHSSAGGLLGGGSAMHIGTPASALDKRLETRGLGWAVGPYMGADWMWGTWEIVEGPTGG